MAPRPNWKGHLKLSLVSCPVALYNATTGREKISFHLLNQDTGNRLRRQLVDSETGDVVESDHQSRAYEIAKGQYVTVEDDELDGVAIESTHTIDIDGFVPRTEINDVYIDQPYYLVPNEKIGEEAFAVIREAMTARGMAGLARVVLNRRERVLMLEPHRKGIVATTLRYPYEIKDEAEFFGAIADVRVDPDMLDLAGHIIKGKTKDFDPRRFEDRYEAALRKVIASKQVGRPVKGSGSQAVPANVVDLMEALRRSVRGPGASSVSAASKDARTAQRAGSAKAAAKSIGGEASTGTRKGSARPADAAVPPVRRKTAR